jgi:hypothetical protein
MSFVQGILTPISQDKNEVDPFKEAKKQRQSLENTL